MMVPSRQQQAQVLLEAVQNHAPDVVIIDEISTKEVRAAEQGQAQTRPGHAAAVGMCS